MSTLSYNYKPAQKYDISGDEGGVARLAKRGMSCVSMIPATHRSILRNGLSHRQSTNLSDETVTPQLTSFRISLI